MLYFTSGPATVVDPYHIKEIGKHRGHISDPKAVRTSPDHRIFLQGQFGDFRIYFLVLHSRPEVVPASVRRISENHFLASIRLEQAGKTFTEHEVAFRAPLVAYHQVRATSYGLFPDAFEFSGSGPGTESFICDLTFLTHQAENAPQIPIKVRYIGIAKAEGREAEDRLGEGHEKLQDMLAELNRRPSRQAVSVVLYRPSELSPPILPFPDVIETIEATMIQYFKPRPYNVERIDFPKDSPALCRKLLQIGSKTVYLKIEAPRGTALWSDLVAPAQFHETHVTIPSAT